VTRTLNRNKACTAKITHTQHEIAYSDLSVADFQNHNKKRRAATPGDAPAAGLNNDNNDNNAPVTLPSQNAKSAADPQHQLCGLPSRRGTFLCRQTLHSVRLEVFTCCRVVGARVSEAKWGG
jgi:hypothetical protein